MSLITPTLTLANRRQKPEEQRDAMSALRNLDYATWHAHLSGRVRVTGQSQEPAPQ